MSTIKSITFLVLMLSSSILFGQGDFQLAVLKYNGGGDYYANPTALPNLIKFFNKNFDAKISEDVPYVEASSPDLMLYPFIHMTGHGNVVFQQLKQKISASIVWQVAFFTSMTITVWTNSSELRFKKFFQTEI